MKIGINTKLVLKDGTKIEASTEMLNSSTGERYRIGFTGSGFVHFTDEDIVLPELKQTIYGSGWLEEFNSKLNDLGLPEKLVRSIRSEANIAWSRSRGAPSNFYYKVANDAIKSLNEGSTPRFTNIDWNEHFKIRHAARLRRGLSEAELSV